MVSHLNKNIVACGFYSRESGKYFIVTWFNSKPTFACCIKNMPPLQHGPYHHALKSTIKSHFWDFYEYNIFPQIGIIIQHFKKNPAYGQEFRKNDIKRWFQSLTIFCTFFLYFRSSVPSPDSDLHYYLFYNITLKN